MKIHYVQGDLIDGAELVIAHGCNARGKYESGVAGAIRRRLPFAYEAYRDAFNDTSLDFKLGEVIWGFDIGNEIRSRIVGNMITQLDYGRVENRVYVNYEAVALAMFNVNQFVEWTHDGRLEGIGSIERIGFPLVGCGLGGGSWTKVSQIIEAECQCFTPVVYTLDGVIPD